ncbi:MAG: cytochrome c biogenesis protein CcsA [Planctomycetota bacterium]
MKEILHNFMLMHPLFQGTFILYLFATLFPLIAVLIKLPRIKFFWIIITGGAFLLNTVLLTFRWIEAGRPPFKTLFETMIFYPWCVSFILFILLAYYKAFFLLPFCNIISTVGFMYATVKPEIEYINLPPALQSFWFIPHVIIYFLSYACLFCSFILATIALLIQYDSIKNFLLKITKGTLINVNFEILCHSVLNLGFTALTFGLVFGAVWGKIAWGDYWSWDPKENWALITWLIYLSTIHLRYIPEFKSKVLLIVIILGFFAVVFTYLGMNLLPSAKSSLHVYQ